jgi:acyl carrier protein
MSIEAQLDKVHGFPEGSREALQDYLETGKRESLDRLVVLAVRHYLPSNTPYKTDPTLEITGDKKLQADLAMDSVSLMELVFFMEETFDVAIESDEMQGLQTIQDLQNFANERLGAKIKATAT